MKIKTIIIFIIIIIGAAAYYTFALKEKAPENNSILNPELNGKSENKFDQEFAKLTLEMESININTEFFKDNVFQSLNARGVVLPEVIPGRKNPFLPIGVEMNDNSSAATDTNTEVKIQIENKEEENTESDAASTNEETPVNNKNNKKRR